ncbi:MAG: KpsF/GutQ family sugar-phosphate isomerase [Acidobacteriia bacterium]|nr:KpsF/GutQ family sugar-phosphate isomerase [Terriglobia bacterium]
MKVMSDAALATAIRVLELEAEAVRTLVPRLNSSFVRAVEIAAACTGKIAVTGMGKSGLICKKIAATLSSTGSPAIFLHAAEAMHGDLGLLGLNDVVLAVSKSGETGEILQILNVVKRLGLPLIAISGDPGSTLARLAEVNLDVSVAEEACPFGLAPTTSTAAALAMGDALAMALMESKGFRLEDFAHFHPAGSIGKKLLRVGELMHRGEAIPIVGEATPMSEVIYEMSCKKLGMTAVADADGKLAGVISDGDLRRLLQRAPDPLRLKAGECMTRSPKTISAEQAATAALAKMEELKITSLVVVDAGQYILGVIHIHDLWRTQMF